jgi:streptogramin lyase
VWAFEQGLGKVRRIDPTPAKPSEPVEGIDAFSIAATRGAVWLGGRTGVTRIDPETGQVLEPVHVSGVVTSATMSITTGASGVWFVGSSQPTVFRISPSENAVANAWQVGAGPSGVAVGDGAVWVANSRDETISRVDPTDGSVDTVPLGSPPGGIVIYHGQVWTSPGEPLS